MRLLDKMKPNSIGVSIPRPRKVRGYEIRRMPIGAYLQAMTGLREFPVKALESVFPGMSLDEIIVTLKACDPEMMGQILLRALSALPNEMMTLVSALSGIPGEKLLTDETIGLDGLVEIVVAWIEVNEIENFMNAARGLWAKAKGFATARDGSRD